MSLHFVLQRLVGTDASYVCPLKDEGLFYTSACKNYFIMEDLRFVSAVLEFRKTVVLPLDQSSSNLS